MTPVEKDPAASCPASTTTIDQEKSFTVNNNKISHSLDNSELTDSSTNGLDEIKPNDELEDLSETLSNNVDVNDSSKQAKDGKQTEALVFKITVKDGKQVLKKVESSPSKVNGKSSVDNSLDNTKNLNGDLNVKIKERTLSTSSKDSYSDKNKNRDKSRDKNSKDKESDRHKKSSSSSSSSHRRSSSSSKSSSSRSHNSSNKSNSSSSSSKSSSRDKDRSRDKDKERSSKSSSSKSSSSKSSSSKDSHRDKDKNKDKDNEKDKVSQAEKDKETLAKVLPPSIDKLGKIPKKPKDESTAAASATAKKASISIEVRNNAESRPKTVKLFNSQFRSHGLAEEAPPPPSRKGLIKPINTSTPGTAIPSSLPTKRMSPPPSYKDAPPEKKSKLESPVLEKPRSIKLIEPKPKREYYFYLRTFINLFCFYIYRCCHLFNMCGIWTICDARKSLFSPYFFVFIFQKNLGNQNEMVSKLGKYFMRS